MTQPKTIPFSTPVYITEYERGYPNRNGWRTIAVATSQYNADIIVAALSAKFPNDKFNSTLIGEIP